MPKKNNRFFQALRRDYQSDGVRKSQMSARPMQQFKLWFDEVVKAGVTDANAFVLATADKKCVPAARVLLMKDANSDGIVFFTNYASDKGKQISVNPRGEAVFFWSKLNRQVRLSGKLSKVSRKESEVYFYTRPIDAQIAAMVSQQSAPIDSRETLEKKVIQLTNELKGKSPKLSNNWGGYQLKVDYVEFWQGRPNRVHDRIVYRKSGAGWKKSRLQP